MDAAAALRQALFDKLHSRQWRAGHRLPPERELGTQFGVSRTTVRRVLQELKEQQLITQTVGSGTYVSAQAPAVLARLGAARAVAEGAGVVTPAELMSARLVLEPALIESVIGHATAADFARMDECNDHAEAATTLEDFEHWDAQLHAAIAAAAHNSVIEQVFRLVSRARDQTEWGVLKRRSATPERRVAYQREHRALVEALKQRDADRARELCRAHLQHVRMNMLGS